MQWLEYFCIPGKIRYVLKTMKTFGILLSLLWLSACTVDVGELPDTPDKLIVQSECTQGLPVDIWITRGVGVPTEHEQPDVPDSMLVQLYIDGQSTSLERHTGNFPFYRSEAGVSFGQELELRVSMPDGSVPQVRAKTYLPYPAHIDEFSFTTSDIQLVDGFRIARLNLSMQFQDSNQEKYYEISLAKNGIGRLMPPIDTLWKPETPEPVILDGYQDNLPEGITWIYGRKSFLIDHRKLAGKKASLDFELSTEAFFDLASMELSVKAHTQDGYAFLKSYDKIQSGYSGSFPILVSNIKDGIGLFSGYALSRVDFLVENH